MLERDSVVVVAAVVVNVAAVVYIHKDHSD